MAKASVNDNDEVKTQVAVMKAELAPLMKQVEGLISDLHIFQLEVKSDINEVKSEVKILQKTKWGTGVVLALITVASLLYGYYTYSPKDLKDDIIHLSNTQSAQNERIALLEDEVHEYHYVHEK